MQKNKKLRKSMIYRAFNQERSYSKRDLNPHSRNGQGILSPSCLPIPPFEHPRRERAENETRTRDPNLGKVMLYQLSYFRNFRFRLLIFISCFPIADAKVVLFSKPPKLFRTFYNTFITLFHQIPHYQYKLELSFFYISRHTVSIIFISETLIYL